MADALHTGSTIPVAFQINGQPWRGDVRAEETLLEFVRERLRLTGTKRSCEVPSLRGLHRLSRRRAHQRLHFPGLRSVRKVCHDDRGSGARRPPGPTPRSLHPTRCSPVWLLSLRDAAGLQGALAGVSQANQRAEWPLPQRQYLPLRGLRPDSRGDPGRRRSEARRRCWPARAASGWPHVSRCNPGQSTLKPYGTSNLCVMWLLNAFPCITYLEGVAKVFRPWHAVWPGRTGGVSSR